jgi:hypothetical protein
MKNHQSDSDRPEFKTLLNVLPHRPARLLAMVLMAASAIFSVQARADQDKIKPILDANMFKHPGVIRDGTTGQSRECSVEALEIAGNGSWVSYNDGKGVYNIQYGPTEEWSIDEKASLVTFKSTLPVETVVSMKYNATTHGFVSIQMNENAPCELNGVEMD